MPSNPQRLASARCNKALFRAHFGFASSLPPSSVAGTRMQRTFYPLIASSAGGFLVSLGMLIHLIDYSRLRDSNLV
jgi:hypothetical protein